MNADPLAASLRIATMGLDNQSVRMRVVSENIANARSTGDTPGETAFRRKTVTFSEVTDRLDAGRTRIRTDAATLPLRYDPGHPAADGQGMVVHPNVSMLTEVADMREASRTYEANLQVMRQARDLINGTIDLLRGR